MESIKELREMLQAQKVNPVGWRRPWGYKTFQRGPSIYITRLLLPTRITPTQVTIAGIMIGLVGCYLLLQFEWYLKLIGLGLLYLNILSDKVDGEIARYKKIYAIRGLYWDEINHLIIPPLFWFSLAYGISQITIFDAQFLLGVAFMGSLALATCRVSHGLAPQIYAKKYLKNKDLFELPAGTMADIEPPRRVWHTAIPAIRALNQFQDFFIIITLTALVIILERFFRLDYIFHPLLAYFILIMSALFVFFALENIIKKSRSIERDIKRIAQVEK